MVDIKEEEGRKLGKRLGKNIAVYRKGLDWTQANVAEKLGVDTETVSRFERGVSLPSLATLDRLAKILSTTISELLGEKYAQPLDQAQIISAWLSDLKKSDRAFALKLLKQTCEHLGPKK